MRQPNQKIHDDEHFHLDSIKENEVKKENSEWASGPQNVNDLLGIGEYSNEDHLQSPHSRKLV